MTGMLKTAVSLVLVAGMAAATVFALRADAAPESALSRSTTSVDIELYERRVAEDLLSAADFQRLAALRLQRGRETGDLEHYRRAEAAARTSLGLRADRNERALLVLASSLLAQHRFQIGRAHV